MFYQPTHRYLNCISILFCLISLVVFSASPTRESENSGAQLTETGAESLVASGKQPLEPAREERLLGILQSVKAAEVERADIIERLKTVPTEAEKKELEEDVERLLRKRTRTRSRRS